MRVTNNGDICRYGLLISKDPEVRRYYLFKKVELLKRNINSVRIETTIGMDQWKIKKLDPIEISTGDKVSVLVRGQKEMYNANAVVLKILFPYSLPKKNGFERLKEPFLKIRWENNEVQDISVQCVNSKITQ